MLQTVVAPHLLSTMLYSSDVGQSSDGTSSAYFRNMTFPMWVSDPDLDHRRIDAVECYEPGVGVSTRRGKLILAGLDSSLQEWC